MSSGAVHQRSKNACLSCTKRKVKCSKTIPCSNCLRRGEQDSCALDLDSPVASVPYHVPEEQSTASPRATQDELEYLRKRVAELQSELQSGFSGKMNPPSMLSSSPLADVATPATTQVEHLRPSRSNSTAIPTQPAEEGGDAVVENAASILEFLAWGRRKNPDYQTVVSPDANGSCHVEGSGDIRDVPDSLEETSDSLDILQLLLPSRRQVWQLVDYHQDCLLWYHNSYFAPTFRRQLQGFYDRFDGIIVNAGGIKRDINLQWIALLFSVLAGSMTCAPPSVTRAWGFRDPERALLGKRWFHAVVICLNKAEYTANQSILSVQAIATLTISAHLLGNSNMQAIHLAAAVRIAQGLGLHRLTDEAPGSIVEKETGRRVWTQLCNQDWFSTSFYETYLINPLYSLSEPPLNCHDDAMIPLPEPVPTITSYCRFLTTVASIMPQLQDGLVSCNTPYTRYDQVLKWDKRLRALATSERPACLSNAPIEPDWPVYIPWARRALAISSSHKIVMIHRSFLSESFVNPAFAFTRRTCLAASKTIIKEYKCVVDEEGPILWIHQAFSVAAAIILVLDILHRDPAEPESVEHRELVKDVVNILQKYESMIALRGTELLSALLSEVSQTVQDGGDRSTFESGDDAVSKRRRLSNYPTKRPHKKLNVPAFVKSFCDGHTVPSQSVAQNGIRSEPSNNGPQHGNIPSTHMQDSLEEFGQDTFYYPPAGLEGASSFDNLLYLANHDFSII